MIEDDERPESPEEDAATQADAPAAPEAEAPPEPEAPEAAAEGAGDQETPAAGDDSVADEAPAAEETPAAEEAPVAQEIPPPAAEEIPVAQEIPPPAAEEIPVAQEIPPPAVEEAPAPAETPVAEETPVTEEQPPAADEAPAVTETPVAEDRPQRRERNPQRSGDQSDVIPGAHLEPDLVLDEAATAREADPYADPDAPAGDQVATEAEEAPQPVATTIIDLAADARYLATGKRKSAVARVIIKPGTGVYTINGKELDAFFPRPTLQRICRGPLETVGQEARLDVVAKIHGGGVSAQAGALRHGIARALVDADPNLRTELKRHGFLTRDPRVKERKKAGLKKARKRPQFSKR